MILLVLVPFESPTGMLKKNSASPSLKLACHQQKSGLRHGVKMRIYYDILNIFCPFLNHQQGTLKIMPSCLKLSCHQRQSVLRHGVKPNCYFLIYHNFTWIQFIVRCVFARIDRHTLSSSKLVLQFYLVKNCCHGLINFWV